MDKFIYHYDWQQDIAPRIPRLEQSDQGYTNAYTGMINLANGTQVFVKCAADESSTRWIQKEIKTYKTLQNAGYEHAPRLLAVNAENTSFAIESLAGCDFSASWDTDKLHAIMRARKDLKSFRHLFEQDVDFTLRESIGTQNRWPALRSEQILTRANDLLFRSESVSVKPELVEQCIDLQHAWQVRQDTLVHGDLRADNFAYDPLTKTGKLIDWAWLCIGDDALDVAALFVGASRTGFDVYVQYPELFDEHAIASTLGYWLEVLGASDGELTEVRRSQAHNVRICLELLSARTQLSI